MKKLLFFDIDGTLVDDDGSIPASTIQAIASAQSRNFVHPYGNLSAPATQHRSMNAVTRCSMTQLCQNIQHSAT